MPLIRQLLLLACLLLPGMAVQAQQLAQIPPLTSPVVDTTGTLDAAQKQQLEQQALDLQQRKGSQLQVLIVPTTQPEDIFDYSQRVFDTWKLGRDKVDDGLLVVVAKDDRRVRIHPGYGLEGAIPDATANRVIQEYMAPKFREDDYGGGLIAATAVLVKLVDGESLPAPVSANRGDGGGTGGGWLFALFAAFIVAQIARAMFSWLPKGVRALLTGGAAGGVAWLLSSLWPLAAVAGVFGLLFGLVTVSTGRYARQRDWGGWGGGSGGGGWGGGGFGGGSGGGWSGGGGMSGGGGASGSW